jgi:hypothetical protein
LFQPWIDAIAKVTAVRTSAELTLSMALLLASSIGAAADIEIKVRDCKSGVELVARDAPLAAVLDRLAKTLGFQLQGLENVDSVVSVDMAAPAPELIAKLLSSQERYLVSHARDPHCPGRSRVARVLLLPKGQQAAGPKVMPAKAAPTKPVPVTETATPEQLQAVDADARSRKQEYDAYIKRHGKPPPEEEEEAARP